MNLYALRVSSGPLILAGESVDQVLEYLWRVFQNGGEDDDENFVSMELCAPYEAEDLIHIGTALPDQLAGVVDIS